VKTYQTNLRDFLIAQVGEDLLKDFGRHIKEIPVMPWLENCHFLARVICQCPVATGGAGHSTTAGS